MSKPTPSSTSSSPAFLIHLPAYILAAEFGLGALVRLSPFPFRAAHADIIAKNSTIAPLLYPLIPFTDVNNHNRYVGTWMIVAAALWTSKRTRGSVGTLGVSLFWSGVLAYSQAKAGMDVWLPVANLGLGFGAWWLEREG